MPRNAPAVQVEPPDDDHLAPGEFYFVHHDDSGLPTGIIHSCPCGCGGRSALFFAGRTGGRQQEWTVTGDWPKATLTPSIGIKYDAAGNRPEGGGFHWHGFLRAGVFEEC